MAGNGATYERQTVRLSDLVPNGETALTDVTFRDCLILGPSLIAPMECNFPNGIGFSEPLEHVLWDMELDDVPTGAIVAKSCTFDACRFEAIGIAGPLRLTNHFRAMEQ